MKSNWLREMFEDENQMTSSMRVMSFELVNAGILVALYAVFSKQTDFETIGMASALITAGLTGKTLSKGQETRAAQANPQDVSTKTTETESSVTTEKKTS